MILVSPAIIGYLVVTALTTNNKQNETLSYTARNENGNVIQEEILLKPLKKLKDEQKYRIKYRTLIYETGTGPKPAKLAYTVETTKWITVHNADKNRKIQTGRTETDGKHTNQQ